MPGFCGNDLDIVRLSTDCHMRSMPEGFIRGHDFVRLAVISAVGTRQYYLERGYQRGELYLLQQL